MVWGVDELTQPFFFYDSRPPGCGKTTLAHVIAKRTTCKFIGLSGSTSSAADMREALERARGERKLLRRRTILFVDEIHRFNKNQQVGRTFLSGNSVLADPSCIGDRISYSQQLKTGLSR